MLQVTGLRRPGLGPISFTVDDGQCLAVTGPSGAGKSLMLRALADLDPNEGSVRFGDGERGAVPATKWRRLVGLVPAESGWWADTVGEHFTDPDGAGDLIAKLGFSGGALDWQISRLSTGEKHRLALARALLLNPKVLLLDEPTAALDKKTTAKVEAVLRRFMKAGVSLVLVTHDPAQVKRLSDYVMTVEDGRAVALEPVQ